jgi:hypothetical protein
LPEFYVYALCDQAAIPFYIGKGKGARIERHEKKAANGANTYTARKIRSIWSGGGEVQRQILWSGLTEQEAFENERFAIATLGRENLTNATDGGEGIAGFSHSEEARRRIGESRKGKYPMPEELKDRLAEMARQRKGVKYGPASEETRRKIGDANRGRTHTEETKKRISEAMSALPRKSGWKHTDETRRKMSEARSGHKLSDETKRQISETVKTYQQNNPHRHTDETKAKMSASHTGQKRSKEAKRNMREARRRYTERVKEERAAAERLTGHGAGEVPKLS